MKPAARLQKIPPYLFVDLEKKVRSARERGVDLVDLGIGDPDQPTPAHVIRALAEAAEDPETHRYPSNRGSRTFREGVARWFESRFGVSLDPEREILALIGSKEGLSHGIWGYVEPGDVTLVPDPAYPVYRNQTLLAGGTPVSLPLTMEHDFAVDFDAIPPDAARKAKLMFLNYPNNPTGGTVDLEFFERAVHFAKTHQILIFHDAAYTEIHFDGFRPPSILEVPGARDVAVEFHSLSKPFNMTGWRIGFAVGGASLLEPVAEIKNHTDSGQFTAIERAALAALLETPEDVRQAILATYQRRRNLMVEALNEAGISVRPPRATFYIWAPVPEGSTSEGFAGRLLEEAGVVVAPGSAYGEYGEGFFRISLTLDDESLAKAAERIRSTFRAGGGA